MAIDLPEVNCSRGAPIGRNCHWPDKVTETVHLVQVRMSSDGAYDSGGAYWGCGDTLYCAYTTDDPENELYAFFRAKNRSDAKRQVIAKYSNAKFFN